MKVLIVVLRGPEHIIFFMIHFNVNNPVLNVTIYNLFTTISD